jgi:RNA polymerase sigma factor (sigma-70 family)
LAWFGGPGVDFLDLNQLFRSYSRRLVRFLTRQVACPEAAADLAQEAFIKMMRAEPATGVHDARAYLFRTASNLATDYRRRQRFLPLVEDSDSVLDALPDPGATPEQVLLTRQELRRLQAAIDALPPRCREVFILARVADLTYAEIGARLGISPKTAFSHVVAALAQLHVAMAAIEPAQKNPIADRLGGRATDRRSSHA